MHLVKKLMAVAALGLLLLAPLSAYALVINEVRADQTGTDYDEYFELMGQPGESLDGLSYIVIGDGTGASGVIECVVDLTGYSIQADGFLSVGEDISTTFTYDVTLVSNALNFENTDNVTHMLVSGFTGAANNDLDVDNDCVLDVMPWASVIDEIALIKEFNPPTTTECYYGANTVGPDGLYPPGHALRCLDGGPWFIGVFDVAVGYDTPGDPNYPLCSIGTEENSWGALKSRY